MTTEHHEKPNFDDLRTSVKNNSPDETPQDLAANPDVSRTLICLSPMYTEGSLKTEWVRLECSNTYKKRPWLLRNAFCAWAWDRTRGLFFDWRLKMGRMIDRNSKETVKAMSSDIRPPNDDRQLSIYELLYVNQCQGISELIEKMVSDGNMTDSQLEFVQKRLLGGLSDRAKAALVIRALYGNKSNQFGE